jgi:hypothetical protein
MKRLLERISWATRKWRCEFKLFNLLLHDQHGSWGFKLFTFNITIKEYSLLAFNCRLPNKTNVRQFTVDDWDVLFLHNYLWGEYDDLSDSKLWGVKLSKWEGVKLHFLNKLFK